MMKLTQKLMRNVMKRLRVIDHLTMVVKSGDQLLRLNQASDLGGAAFSTLLSDLTVVSDFVAAGDAGAEDALESVLQKPLPLNTTPTLLQSLRTAPLQSGQISIAGSEKDCTASNW
ncbi:hypothetical protein FGO68_gene5612 [Halteria grandinella]|uniref:Uncharacterized protein n=1 Tax=Halteria grandinella TaxID=5974 RepID=A0A8J8NA48_HALGN|nr:hypothetical protein FGO68_gene5612 [Halteria grandinella]